MKKHYPGRPASTSDLSDENTKDDDNKLTVKSSRKKRLIRKREIERERNRT